ncbi:MAG: hypothetical protein KAR31_07765, partial [Candidatus Omnitrophica bacterium]|nr:hypothetical protein [Candidatus Omnitrophota bacterium]
FCVESLFYVLEKPSRSSGSDCPKARGSLSAHRLERGFLKLEAKFASSLPRILDNKWILQ